DNVLKLAFVLPEEIFISIPIAGSSFNDFMVEGFRKVVGPRAVFYWNGKKWSLEKAKDDFFVYGDNTYLQRINDNYYCGIVQRVPVPFLIRGFRK
ncbi:MAG: hypothetical protein LWX07_07970, partial [Bacteroidetes bacterium]|nr:hypothetical protein [Bacteroidota bacterium]